MEGREGRRGAVNVETGRRREQVWQLFLLLLFLLFFLILLTVQSWSSFFRYTLVVPPAVSAWSLIMRFTCHVT